jgi:hypothetical protein
MKGCEPGSQTFPRNDGKSSSRTLQVRELRRTIIAATLSAPPTEPDLPPALQMMQLATGYFVSRAVFVAAELGLADHLAGGPRDAASLAAVTGSDARSLYRLLRALASAGVFEHLPDDRFALTRLGASLRTDAPDTVRDGVRMFHQPMFWRSWEALQHSIATGQPALDHVFGAPVFEYLAQHPEAAAPYDGGMTALNAMLLPAIVGAYDWSAFGVIADIAGGHGSLLAAILDAAPGTRGVLVDLAHVTPVAERTFATRGLTGRVRIVTGSMFESVPGGADAYTLKWILHDWDDDACTRILTRIREAIPGNGRLLVIERVLPERATATLPVRTMMMADLTMMVHLTGCERTEAEFRSLFESSGFRLARIVPTGAPLSIIEARPA